MSILSNKLDFTIPELNSCKLLGILDLSEYAGTPTGLDLQVLIPGGYPVRELNYYKNALTILNSNTLGLTNVDSSVNYVDLPDGVWVVKIGICPYNVFWAEKKWYRTCQIWCKFHKAFLKLELNKCDTCYNKEMADRLDTAERYIKGCESSVINADFSTATSLYNVANTILDRIISCDCQKGGVNTFNSNGCC